MPWTQTALSGCKDIAFFRYFKYLRSFTLKKITMPPRARPTAPAVSLRDGGYTHMPLNASRIAAN